MRNKFIILFIIIGLVVYLNSFQNKFVWDDEEQIVNNTMVHSIKYIPQLFQGSTFNSGGSNELGGIYYKPLMSVCFNILYSIFGPNPTPFHLFQTTIHIINVILIFLIFSEFFPVVLAGALSIIFLVHPINTETVVYISALQDVLYMLFGLLSFLIIKRFPNSIKAIFLSSIFIFLSILSKETGILFLFINFIYLFLYNKKQILLYLIFNSITITIYLFLRFVIAGVGFEKFGISPISRAPLIERLITSPKIIITYLMNFIYPINLAILQHWTVKRINLFDFWLPVIVIISSIMILILLIKSIKPHFVETSRDRQFIFFFIWFVLGLGLHSQIIALDMTYADRWFYFPIIGLLGLIGIIIKSLDTKKWYLRNLFFLIIIILLSVRTVIRNFDWKNGLTLYSHDIKISKNAYDLENNLGVELFRNKQYEKARDHFQKSTELAPYWWTNWNNLGVTYEKTNDFKTAEKYYKRALTNSDYYLAYENYSLILLKQNKIKEAQEFIQTIALPKFPYNEKLNQFNEYLNKNIPLD